MAGPGSVGGERARAGVSEGFLQALPTGARERLLAEAIRITVSAGALLYRDDESPRVFAVISGLLREFLDSADGRQVTVRYLRPGDVAGLALALAGPRAMRLQAMTQATVVALRVGTLRSLLAADPEVASACAEELTRELSRALDDLAEQAFLSVRQRIVRQLLNLASPGEGRKLVVHVSHEELADAVASVRRVVTRTLHELRTEGLIETSRDGIVLIETARLSDEAGGHGRPAGPDGCAGTGMAAPRSSVH